MKEADDYIFDDFIDDDSFIKSIKYPKTENTWSAWLKTEPANMAEYLRAKAYVITFLSAQSIEVGNDTADELLYSIFSSIDIAEHFSARRRFIWSAVSGIAASFFIAISCLWFYNSKVTVVTGYGARQTVILPDQSIIILNANSKLTYYRSWELHSKREVWLEGEALFNIVHINHTIKNIKPSERFVTHAGNLEIQVLGTTFNVKRRGFSTSIALIKGRISVANMNAGVKPLLMEAGEAIEVKGSSLKKIPLNRLVYQPTAWTNDKIIASGMTVKEIIDTYQDTYGGKIILRNKALAFKKIDGTISLKSRESTLYMLANLLNAIVEQHRDTTYLNSK